MANRLIITARLSGLSDDPDTVLVSDNVNYSSITSEEEFAQVFAMEVASGSGVTVIPVSINSGSAVMFHTNGDELSYDNIANIVHEAVGSNNGRFDGAQILDYFENHPGVGGPLIGRRPNAYFRITRHERDGLLSGSNRVPGVGTRVNRNRSGPINFADPETGVIAKVKEFLDFNMRDLIRFGRTRRSSLFVVPAPCGTTKTLSIKESILTLMRCSCVLFSLLIRFMKGFLGERIRTFLGSKALKGAVGSIRPPALRVPGGRLLLKLIEILAKRRGVSPLEVYQNQLHLPLNDVDIYAISQECRIMICVLMDSAIDKFYTDIVEQESSMTIAPNNQITGIESLCLQYRGMIVMGQEYRTGERLYNCEAFVLRVSLTLSGDVAHAEGVFDHELEYLISNKRYTSISYQVTYKQGLDTSEMQGYYSNLLETNPIDAIPEPFVSFNATSVTDLEKYYKKDNVKLQFIKTKQDLDNWINKGVRMVAAMKHIATDPIQGDERQPLSKLAKAKYPILKDLGTTIFLSTDLVNQLREESETKTDGMIIAYSLMYMVLGVTDVVSMGLFSPNNTKKSLTRIFSRYNDYGDLKEIQGLCISRGIISLHSFVVVLKRPFFSNANDKTGMKRLKEAFGGFIFRVRYGDEEDYIIRKEFTKSKPYLDAKDRALRPKIKGRVRRKKREYMEGYEVDESDIPPNELDYMKEEAKKEVYEEANDDAFIVARINMSILSMMMTFMPTITARALDLYATTPTTGEEMVEIYDPNFDEPIMCVSAIRPPSGTEAHYSIDMRFAYAFAFLGVFDHCLELDLYKQSYVHYGLDCPYSVDIDFEHYGLWDYKAHAGCSLLNGIDYATLERWWPAKFNKLNSWHMYDDRDPTSIKHHKERNSAIIHLTMDLVRYFCELVSDHDNEDQWPEHLDDISQYVENGVLNQREFIKYFQRDVLRIKHCWFVHSPLQIRLIIKIKELGGGPRKTNFRLKGIQANCFNGDFGGKEINEGRMNALRRWFNDMVNITADIKRSSLPDNEHREELVEKFVKKSLVEFFGNLKYGSMGRGLHTTGTSSLEHVGSFCKWGNDVSMPAVGGTTALFSKELPGTGEGEPKVLAYLAQVLPVAQRNSLKSMRNDTLTKTKLIMDELAFRADAYKVKTDEIHFTADIGVVCGQDKFEDLLEVGRMDHETELDALKECIDSNCEEGELCKIHFDTRFSATETSRNRKLLCFEPGDYLYGLKPLKIIRKHPGTNVAQYDHDRNETDLIMANPVVEPEFRGENRDTLATLEVKALKERSVEVTYTSSFIPWYLIRPIEMDQTAIHTTNPVEIHCEIMNGRPVNMDGICYGVPKPQYVKGYSDNILSYMQRTTGGRLLVGRPGAGKSKTIEMYVKQLLEHEPETYIFIVTSTNQTMRPYRKLSGNENLSVSTIHRFMGCGIRFKDACRDIANHMRNFTKPSIYKSWLCNDSSRYNRVEIIIDEYELLGREVGNFSAYFGRKSNHSFTLLGDPKQTGAIGDGILHDSPAVLGATNFTELRFDLPFRNPDYEVYKAQDLASTSEPIRYLQEPLCRDHGMAYDISLNHIPDALSDILQKCKIINETQTYVICASSHKAATALYHIYCKYAGYPDPESYDESEDTFYLTHIGFSTSGDSAKGEGYVDAGEEEASAEEPVNDANMRKYIRNRDFSTYCPGGLLSNIGTMVWFRPGMRYKAIQTILPRISFKAPFSILFQERVNLGAFLVYKRFVKKMQFTQSKSSAGGGTVKHYETNVYEFEAEDGELLYLTQREMEMYLLEPYTSVYHSILGHEYNGLANIAFLTKGTNTCYLDPSVYFESIGPEYGEDAWQDTYAKHYNVASSRVLAGDCMDLLRLAIGRKSWFVETIRESPYFNKSFFIDDPREQNVHKICAYIRKGKMLHAPIEKSELI